MLGDMRHSDCVTRENAKQHWRREKKKKPPKKFQLEINYKTTDPNRTNLYFSLSCACAGDKHKYLLLMAIEDHLQCEQGAAGGRMGC